MSRNNKCVCRYKREWTGGIVMNHYDDEENIIRLLQSIPLGEIHLVNPTRDVKKFF